MEPQGTPPAKSAAPSAARPRIEGWLVLAAIVLLIQPIMVVKVLFDLQQALRQQSAVLRVVIHYPALIYDLVVGAVTAVILVQFFRKKAWTPALVQALYPALFIALLALFFLGTDEAGFRALLVGAQAVFMVSYFSLSKRVRATFVVPASAGAPLDHLTEPIARWLGPYSRLLSRLGWWVIPAVAAGAGLPFLVMFLIDSASR